MALPTLTSCSARARHSKTRALRGLNLEVPAGQFLTVIGSNGAGKSTALNVIAGSIAPSNGEVIIDGVDITRWPVHARSRMISRVFQDPESRHLRTDDDPGELRGRL
jgi:putative ABC transport system ATP-binding protein